MTDSLPARDRALPDRARVVVVGGGVIGASVAYHLAGLGWTDLLLLEQGQLCCGTTWHAAGLVGQLRATESGTRLVQYSTELYSRLEEETGQSTGFRRCGGVTVARAPERLTQLRRTAATAEAFGLDCELISPARAGELFPMMDTADLCGALWLPGDGRADPTGLTAALARGARTRGATIRERTRVTGISTAGGAVTGVRTGEGDIEAEIVVNCAGQWAKQVGALAGVNVPLHSAEHFYVVTEQVGGAHRWLPILRDPDGYTYFKEEVGGLVVGGFEPQAKPWVAPDELPSPFEFQLLDEDWEHFSVLMESALHRIRSTTARRASPRTTSSSSARLPGCGTSSWPRASTRSGSPRQAARARRWPNGSPAASQAPTCWPTTSGGSPRSTATTSGCTTGWARSSACTTRCRGRTAS